MPDPRAGESGASISSRTCRNESILDDFKDLTAAQLSGADFPGRYRWTKEWSRTIVYYLRGSQILIDMDLNTLVHYFVAFYPRLYQADPPPITYPVVVLHAHRY
jgi:hypothetical protein